MDSTPALFRPITIGRNVQLLHRVVHAPLTRMRTNESDYVVLPIVKEYYTQRASTPGTLFITEGSDVHPSQGGIPHISSFHTEEAFQRWKEIVDSVHAKGSYIFLQLAGAGRAAMPSFLPVNPSSSNGERYPFIAPSPIPLSDRPPTEPVPREMTIAEIQEAKRQFAIAARNAIEICGFDGVEIHGANGYLVDQFIQDISNKRTDEYGGSVENRVKFALEVVEEVAKVIGEDRTAIRISPWNTYQDMGMVNPEPTFSYLASELKLRYPNLAYLHVIEPRIAADSDASAPDHASNDFLRKIWAPKVLISAGGYTTQTARDATEKNEGELIAMGRHFLANPDLPERMRKELAFNAYDRSTFYIPGDNSGRGYVDYPFAQGTKLPN